MPLAIATLSGLARKALAFALEPLATPAPARLPIAIRTADPRRPFGPRDARRALDPWNGC